MNIIDVLAAHPATAFAGFGLGLSLIVAIGAQNAYVLRQGALREHVVAVIGVCILSDIALILAGVAGFGTLLEQAPWVVTAMRWGGAAFLLVYGLLAAKRAWRPAPSGLAVPKAEVAETDLTTATAATATLTAVRLRTKRLLPVVLTTLALTWLNPHVYLDTVVLLGSVANTHGANGRWAFALGACVASVVWFAALGYGSRQLSRWLATPVAWRILDGVIAVIMLTLAASLVLTS